MAYFPKIGPFYDPQNEQEFYGEHDGRLRMRHSHDRRDSGTGASLRDARTNTSFAEKSESGWNDFVQDHGNLFYTEPNPSSSDRQMDTQSRHISCDVAQPLPNNHSSLPRQSSNHTRQSSFQSDNSSRQNFRDSRFVKLYERENAEQDSFNELHMYNGNAAQTGKNKHVQFDREDRDRRSDGSTKSAQSDSSYTTFSNYLDQDIGITRTSNRSSLRQDTHMNESNRNDSHRQELYNQSLGRNGSFGGEHQRSKSNSSSISSMPIVNVSQSGKRKSVYMEPVCGNVGNVGESSGVELCEQLFGIKLCQYKSKPPRPNGSMVDQVLRDRKVIVQGVVTDSQADICGQIHRGDMLVGLNDADVTWVNIDDLFRLAVQQDKVKLTFQVPVVIGPKQATPPLTPTASTPPLIAHALPSSAPPVPPHIPIHQTHPRPPPPPPRPPPPRSRVKHDLLQLTTGETLASMSELLRRYLFALLYLTYAGHSEESKDDVIYQYPLEDNKLVEVRGLFLTLNRLTHDITNDQPSLTTIQYRGHNIHIAYWRNESDALMLCLPEGRVSSFYLCHILTDLIHLINVLYGSVTSVFRDVDLHGNLDQLISLTLYRLLSTDCVASQTIPVCSPLEPALLDTLSAVRWLRLSSDDQILCDEILSEYEAQDFMDLEEVTPEERRPYGIIGSCFLYKDYLLCSHLCQEDLRDTLLFLNYHCLLHLVNKQSVDDLVVWREIYPTHLCHMDRPDNPGYREPRGRWFLLVTGMNHFLHCTILETGSYASQTTGRRDVDRFFVEQSKSTLSQLDVDDTHLEIQCNERLLSESTGPRLQSIDTVRQMNRQASNNDVSSAKRMDSSPRLGVVDSERTSVQSAGDTPTMRRQGSKLSYGSNDSNGSSNSVNINKGKSPGKKSSVMDISISNRSFTDRDISRPGCDIKLTRCQHNLLLHYVRFDGCRGVYVSPGPADLARVHGPMHDHLLYNFYNCCLKLHKGFELYKQKKMRRGTTGEHGPVEEAVMFTCQPGLVADMKRPPPVLMYWVVGRLTADGQELYVCLEDGGPQVMLELAFSYTYGLS